MPRESVYIAMAIGIDFRFGARAPDKRIVGWNAAVVAEPQHFSSIVAKILREHSRALVIGGHKSVAIADREVHHAVGAERSTARQGTAGFPGIRHENLMDIGERHAVKTSARQRQSGALLVTC